MAYIRKIGNNHYWYESKVIKGKTFSIYKGKATTEEVKRYARRRAKANE